MEFEELAIPGVLEFSPSLHSDERGLFLEWYRYEPLAGPDAEPLPVRQANLSVSRKGVVRGIHFALTPPGQAKYVTAVAGSIVDYIVDLRVDSPAFGTWVSTRLDDVTRRCLFLPPGVGHAFVAASDSATVCYLASEVYDPAREKSLDAFDSEIGLVFPTDLELFRSPRDSKAPSFAELVALGQLPGATEPGTS